MAALNSPLVSAGAGLQRACHRGWQMFRAHAPLPARRTTSEDLDAYPTEAVEEWRRAAKEIASSPHQAEEIAWVESVSVFFEEDSDE